MHETRSDDPQEQDASCGRCLGLLLYFTHYGKAHSKGWSDKNSKSSFLTRSVSFYIATCRKVI